MAISPKNAFPGKIDLTDPVGFPEGKAKDITAPGSLDGTPWVALLLNDLFGFQQAILAEVAAVPTGAPDKVNASQYLDAIKQLIAAAAVTPQATEILLGGGEIADDTEALDLASDTRLITPLKLGVVLDSIVPVIPPVPVAIYADIKSSGSAGGTSVAGFQTRTLNTEVSDIQGLGTLSGDAVTLEAGTYLVDAYASGYQSNDHAIYLNDGTSRIITGINSFNQSGNADASTNSILTGVIVSTGFEAYSIEHYFEVGRATEGLGRALSSGESALFCSLKFTQIG